MANSSTLAVSPEKVVDQIVRLGVTHIPYLPDIERNVTYRLMASQPALHLIPVAREGEAIAIASGLIVGGKKPLVVIQNTGMFESGDSIRAFGHHYARIPFVMMIGYRGWTPNGNSRDCAATFTEPTLRAWDVPYMLIHNDSDLPKLSEAYERATAEMRPHAVLMPEELT